MKQLTTILLILTIVLSCKNHNQYMEQDLPEFKIIGISVETTNENGKSVEDMGKPVSYTHLTLPTILLV